MGQKNKCGILRWGERINDPRATAAEGRRWATAAYHQNVQKKKKKRGECVEGVSIGDSKPRGGWPDCCQHWLYPPPKATGMLSAQCSICTENKGPVTEGDKNRTELSHFRCHSPGKHHGPHLEHIVRIKVRVNKQATKRDLESSPVSTNDFYRRRPNSSPGVPQKV